MNFRILSKKKYFFHSILNSFPRNIWKSASLSNVRNMIFNVWRGSLMVVDLSLMSSGPICDNLTRFVPEHQQNGTTTHKYTETRWLSWLKWITTVFNISQDITVGRVIIILLCCNVSSEMTSHFIRNYFLLPSLITNKKKSDGKTKRVQRKCLLSFWI